MLDTIRFEFQLNSELAESTKDLLLDHIYQIAEDMNSGDVVTSLSQPTIWFTLDNIDIVIALKYVRNIGSWLANYGPYHVLSASASVVEESDND